jgi:hypothetical protein
MDFDNQLYKLYVTSALLFYEKQRIQEIFDTYSTRLSIINDKITILLNDINNLKNVENITDRNIQLNKLIELLSNNNELNNDINIKCNNIDNINNEINRTINKDSKDYNFIKNVCEDKLGDKDKDIIQGDLFNDSTSDKSEKLELDNNNDLEKIKKAEYNAKRRAKRLENKLEKNKENN